MSTMPRAYGFTDYGGPEMQEFMDVPKPTPGPAELLVAVKAAGVNPADWKVRAGLRRDVMALDMPAVLGREVAGVVTEIGQDVDGFAVGDEVFGYTAPGSGGYAEFTLVTAAAAAKKPSQVTFTDAATLAVAAGTAYDGVAQLGLSAGQSLLIVGIGGGVGVAAAQLARDLGIFVIGTGSEHKRELAESLGATLVTYGEGVVDRVRAIMPGGVDAIFDLVGGVALREVVGLVQDRAKIISAADPATAEELGGAAVQRDRSTQTLSKVAQLVANGKLDPHVSDVVPLERAGDALHAVESGHARGKVVIEVSAGG
jgi:NADPH2:quinone reductase